MNSKKSKIALWVSIAIISLIAVLITVILWFLFRVVGINDPPPFTGLLLNHGEAYNQTVQLIYDDFQKCECSGHGYWFTQKEEYANVSCEDKFKTILVNDSEYAYFQTVKNTFRVYKRGLDFISVNGNYIVFGIVTGRGSLIYSVNDEKPNFINSPGDKENYKWSRVRKVTDNWYFVNVVSLFPR